ncbi:hypothetical protein N2152v2_001245 [Parachlorella kessleri]
MEAGGPVGLQKPLKSLLWHAVDEELIRATADLMVSLGLRDAGYEYLVLDGLKFGIYSDSGYRTCGGYPGSFGYEDLDAQTWADWGVDYLKYTAMRDALNKTGRPIIYSLCEWGLEDPWQWAPTVGNSWRTTDDIAPSWDSILAKLDNTLSLAQFAGPGAWNDPDMLEVGNGNLLLGEQRAHFALWALLKAPLMIGTDLRRLPKESLEILTAKEVLAVHQDGLGVAAELVGKSGAKEVYAAPLADGSRAVVLFNRHTLWGLTEHPTSNITVHWQQVGLNSSTVATVRDLFQEKDLGEFGGSFTAAVPLHDVVVVKVTPKGAPGSLSWRPWEGQGLFAR